MASRIGSQSDTPMPPTAPCKANRRETRSFFRISMAYLHLSVDRNPRRRAEGVTDDEVGDQVAKHVAARAQARLDAVNLRLVVKVIVATIDVAIEVAEQALGYRSVVTQSGSELG